MSTILKALKRLDGERRAEAPLPTLEEQVLAGGRPAVRERRRGVPWPALLGVGVAMIAGGLAWRLFARGDDPPEAPAPAVAAAPTAAPAAPGPQPLIAEPRAPAPYRPAAGTAVPPALRERLRTNAIAAKPGAPSGVSPDGEESEPTARAFPPAAAVSAAAPPAARSAATEAPPAPAAQEHRTSSPSPAASPPPARVAVQASPAPREASAQRAPEPEPVVEAEPAPDVAVIAPRPELWVDRTQWHPSPEKRSALVRGASGEARELREGDEIDGVLVKEIKPSGVIFARAGDEWRRNVGSN